MPPYASALTVAYQRITNLLAQELSIFGESPASEYELSTHIAKLEDGLSIINATHKQWVDYLESLSVDDQSLQAMQTSYESFFQQHPSTMELTFDVSAKVAGLKQQLCKMSSGPNQWSSTTPQGSRSNGPTHMASGIKLPDLPTPSFNGSPLKWSEFWDVFDATIHSNPSLSDVQKLAYLKGMVSGSALSAIASLRTTNVNYDAAIKILRDRFGQPDAIKMALYNKLRSIRMATNKVSDLQSTQDAIIQVLTQLESYSVDTNQGLIIQLIFEKFPMEFVTELVNTNTTTGEWTIQQLQTAITQLIKRKEQVLQLTSKQPTYQPQPTPKQQQQQPYQPPPKPHPQPEGGSRPFRKPMGNNDSSSNNRSYRLGEPTKKPVAPCIFCNKSGHYHDQCNIVRGIEDRKRKLNSLRVCHLCLDANHIKLNCPKKSTVQCYHCKQYGAHHNALCPKISQKPISSPHSGKPKGLCSFFTSR